MVGHRSSPKSGPVSSAGGTFAPPTARDRCTVVEQPLTRRVVLPCASLRHVHDADVHTQSRRVDSVPKRSATVDPSVKVAREARPYCRRASACLPQSKSHTLVVAALGPSAELA
jgi:hypothetical protein